MKNNFFILNLYNLFYFIDFLYNNVFMGSVSVSYTVTCTKWIIYSGVSVKYVIKKKKTIFVQ